MLKQKDNKSHQTYLMNILPQILTQIGMLDLEQRRCYEKWLS